MTATDFPAELIALERAAWEELQAGQLTVAASGAVHAAVSEYAAEAGLDRYTVEMALKKAVRRAEA